MEVIHSFGDRVMKDEKSFRDFTTTEKFKEILFITNTARNEKWLGN